MKMTIPNLLSVIRVLLAPAVAIAFAVFERPQADQIAILIFIGAALTDYLDGVLARALGQESAFGRMLDPIADKAMVIIALAMIVALYDMAWPIVVPAVAIIMREVLVSGLREFLGDVKLDVTRLAKWKTTLQMIAVCLLLVRGAISPEAGSLPVKPIGGNLLDTLAIAAAGLGLLMLWIAAWFSVVTGWDYFAKGMPYIREREGQGRRVADDAGD